MLTTLRPKTCKCCKAKFQPMLRLQSVCSPMCGLELARSKRLKAERAKLRRELEHDRERRKQLERIPDLIASAQVAFNAYIRQRDKDRGCFVCGKAFVHNGDSLGGVMDAGHVRSRGAAKHLRFTEDNCHGECKACNRPHGALPHQIAAGAIARIGQERYDALVSDNTPHKWTREELRAIKAKYSALRRELERAA